MNRTRIIVIVVALAGLAGSAVVAALLFLHFRSLQRVEPAQVGGLYSFVAEPGRYGVLKVLRVDPNAVHVRVYQGHSETRPVQVDPAALKLASIHDDQEAPGIGHLPITPGTFAEWSPRLLRLTAVAPEELDGYEEWKKAGGAVWGE